MLDPFVEHLRRRIDAERERVTEALVSGGVSSIENYRYMVGTIHGLMFVQREIDELLTAINKER